LIIIAELKEASEAALADINRLLPQLRSNPSQHRGSLTDLQMVVASPSSRLIVATEDDRIVGMATLHVVNNVGKRVGHVDDVVVDEAYRGQGLGRRIMAEVVDVAKTMKVNQLRLTSRAERLAANRLYPKLGFELLHTNVYGMRLM
jgi:ribosomal protein S18 acetylase RimI-like enzyme